jgi:hypothetical protein
VQALDQEVSLQVNRVDEKDSQLFHFRARRSGEKFRARIPWARFAFSPKQLFWQFCTPPFHVANKRRKAFLERSTRPRWVPDEMPDPKRRKVFPGVPGSQARNAPAALVLPDLAADAHGVLVR